MSKPIDDLLALVAEGDVEACVSWFAGMPEAERRALAPRMIQEVRLIDKNSWIQDGNSYTLAPATSCAPVLMLCTASLSELKSTATFRLPKGELAYRLLIDRSPPWIDAWAAHLLEQERYWFAWTLVRRLVREGLIERPTSPRYVLAMISGLPSPVLDELRADPELLDHEIWELFEHEGAGENSLTNADRFGGDGWSHALQTLAEEGRLDRQRLLDSCLSALQRDFSQYRARWFTTFFDQLKPSKAELSARAERFSDLLRVSAEPVVSWAFKKVEALVRSKAYEPDTLVTAIEPVMAARGKGLVKRALKQLARLAKHPDLHEKVTRRAVQALGHEAQDVQSIALDLLESMGPPANDDLIALADAYRDLVAPSLKPRLETWLGVEADTTVTAERPDVSHIAPEHQALFALDALLDQPGPSDWSLPAARFDGTDLPRLVGPAAAPVADLDELLALITQGLEDNLTPLELERTLDGIARLCSTRPDDFERLTGPVGKRAVTVLERDAPFVGGEPCGILAGIVVSWLTGSSPTTHVEKRQHYDLNVVVIDGESYGREPIRDLSTADFLNQRSLRLAQQVGAGITQPLLALPTHDGGFLDPTALAERVGGWQGPAPHPSEVALAMLRLAPERRSEALQRMPTGDAEWIRALRYALGGTEEIGNSAALWICAARARAPFKVDPSIAERFPSAGPDAGEPATYGDLLQDERKGLYWSAPAPADEAHIDPDCVPQLLHAGRSGPSWGTGSLGQGTASSLRWLATLWPQAQESFFAGASQALGNNLDWWAAEWQHKALLEPLLDPRTPLRDMGLFLLAIGLGAKEPGEHLLAVDAAITAIEDGRLGSDNLGRVLRKLLVKPFVKVGRYAKTLTAIAEASEAHAAVVFLALDAALPAVLQETPRDYGKLLDLTEQLGVRVNASVSPECGEALRQLKGSAKAKKTAARIVANTSTNSAEQQAATALLATMRAEAALRAFS